MRNLKLTNSHCTPSDYDLVMPLDDDKYYSMLLLSAQSASDNIDDDPAGGASNDYCEGKKKKTEPKS